MTPDAILNKRLSTGQEMRQVQLGLPGSVGGGTVTAPKVQAGGPPQGTGKTVIHQERRKRLQQGKNCFSPKAVVARMKDKASSR